MGGLQLENVWQAPLAELSGGTLTLASIVTGAVIVALFVLFAALTGRALRKLLERTGVPEGGRFAISKIVRYLIIFVGVMVAFNTMGLSLGAVLAASTVLLVGIGFGLQEIAKNFISGLILLIEQPVRKGDFIQVRDTYGVVEDIRLRATHVSTRDAVTIIVPNNELIISQVVNHSILHPSIRVPIRVGVSYGSDVQRVRDVLLEVAEQSRAILREPVPTVRFDDFGESSLDFTLLVWIADPSQDMMIASEIRFAITQAFRANGIEIPFPQRDLHLRSWATEAYIPPPRTT